MRKPLPGKGRAALFFVVVLAVAAYFAYDAFLAPKPERRSYAEFYSLVLRKIIRFQKAFH